MISLNTEGSDQPRPDSWLPTLHFARKWTIAPAVVFFLFLTVGSWIFDHSAPGIRWITFSVLISGVFYLLLWPAAGLLHQAWREFQVNHRPDLGGRWVVGALVALGVGLWLFRLSGGLLWAWFDIPVFSFGSQQQSKTAIHDGGHNPFLHSDSEAIPMGPLDPNHPVYRAILNEATGGPPNFSRDWRVLEFDCGTACQQLVLIHQNSRNILWGPTASAGARYGVESNRLVINPPENIAEAYGDDPPEWLETVEFELVGQDQPRLRRLP